MFNLTPNDIISARWQRPFLGYFDFILQLKETDVSSIFFFFSYGQEHTTTDKQSNTKSEKSKYKKYQHLWSTIQPIKSKDWTNCCLIWTSLIRNNWQRDVELHMVDYPAWKLNLFFAVLVVLSCFFLSPRSCETLCSSSVAKQFYLS